ncbi:MAG: carboxypeptidase-like regulatory domain-containing protein [Acidobacteriota bacterium]
MAQTPPRPGSPLAGPAGRAARIEGQVVADANGLPLRRTQVILSPLEAGRPALGTQTDDRGNFVLRDIEPGNYSLTAQRDGYLSTTTFRRGATRMPPRFALGRGDTITNVTFRLRPWSVVSGKIRFEDGDSAVGVRIELYRQYRLRGRHGFTRVASTITNDRGEYRMHGLAPGPYFVAVAYEGDQTGPGVDDQARLDSSGNELPVPSYSTTFYPNTLKLSEAVPVRLREGDDISGIDIYMRPVERVTLAGRVTDGLSGVAITAAAITMERLDSSNNGTLPVPVNLTFDKEERFHMSGVAPGEYQMWVDASSDQQRLVGRSRLQVTNSNIEDLELVVLPARPWSGEVVAANGADPLPREFAARIVLEPRSERGAILNPSPNNGKFDVLLAAGETYDVFVMNLPDDLYLSEVRAAGVDVRAAGLSSSMASNLPFQIVIDSRGGSLLGRVQGPPTAQSGTFLPPDWPGATIALIPDSPRGRLHSYKQVFANEYGQFQIGGIPAGRYILTAWLDDPPCDVYDEDDLNGCRQTGMMVDVRDRTQQEVVLNVKALSSR